MRTRLALGIGALSLAAVAGTTAVLAQGGGEPTGTAPRPSRETALVERRDLVVREEVAGTLGYADERELAASAAGTLTWVPKEGSSVRRGGRLYRVDDQAVRLLYGRLPAWRGMSDGVEGTDVEQLERNLAALGYTDGGEMVVDDEYDEDTADAVRDWQDDIGEAEDGVIDLGEIVFLDGPRRIGAHQVTVGDGVGAGSTVLSTTSLEQVVTVDLNATQQELARDGDEVTVELPDGRTIPGRITHVSGVAEADPAAEEGADPTIEVTISLRRRTPGGLDQAPVEVGLAADAARDALAVPVEALLALAEGGFALEVVEGRGSRLVGVDTGVHADGWVEITSSDIEEGTEVVVAR